MKKTSHEWNQIYNHLIIYDPDGWDRSNYQYSFYEELITEEEFNQRIVRSTVIIYDENCNNRTTNLSKNQKG